MKHTFIGIAIGIVVTLFFTQFHCGGSKDRIITRIDTVVKISLITDTFIRDTGSIVRVPIKAEVPIYIKDTDAVITDYFTYYKSDDTLRGKDYEIAINDILYMNRLWLRQASVNITKRDTTITVKETITKSSDGLYLGAETSLNLIGPDIQYIKGRWSYGGNVKFDPSGFKAKELNLRINYKLIGK